ARGATLGLNVAVHVLSLIFADADRARECGSGVAVIECVKREIHLLIRKGEVKLILPLRKTVSVGRRHGVADLFGKPHVSRERIDLGLVEMSDRLHIRAAVAVLHEESLVVLQPVRGADNRIVQTVSVKVLHCLANALFEIRRGDDLQVLAQAKAFLFDLPRWRLHDDLKMVDPTLEPASDDDLVLPAFTVVWKYLANRLVALAIAADRLECRCNIEHFILYSEMLRELSTARRAETGRVPLREHQAVNAPGTKRRDDQRAAPRPAHAA